MKRLLTLCAGLFLLSVAIASAQKVVVSSKGYTEKKAFRYAPAGEANAAFGDGMTAFGAELYPLAARYGRNHWAGLGLGYSLEQDGDETYDLCPMMLSYQYNHFFSGSSSVSAFVNARAGVMDIRDVDDGFIASFRVGVSFDASVSRHSIGVGLATEPECGVLLSLAYSVSFGL